MKLADRIFDAVLPADERVPRDVLVATANKYFDVVSGTLNYRDAPWHPECHRIELGVFTVSSTLNPGSCGGEFQNPRIKWIVKNRRVYVADVERGVVGRGGEFHQSARVSRQQRIGRFRGFKVQDGSFATSRPCSAATAPRRARAGRICPRPARQCNSTLSPGKDAAVLDSNLRRFMCNTAACVAACLAAAGFVAAVDANAPDAARGRSTGLRSCLSQRPRRSVSAGLLARDPKRLSWAHEAKFTENAVVLKPATGCGRPSPAWGPTSSTPPIPRRRRRPC